MSPARGKNLTLLNYFQSSSTFQTQLQRPRSGRPLSTEMVDGEQGNGSLQSAANKYDNRDTRQLVPANDQVEEVYNLADDADEADDDEIAAAMSQLVKYGLVVKDGRMMSVDMTDAVDAANARDLSPGIIGKAQGQECDLLTYFHGIGSRSLSNSGAKTSRDSRIVCETNTDLGSQYFTREPSAALNRLSGGLKYNGPGRWSGNMSDVMDSNASGGLLSLMIPESGCLRGAYSNSVSPLGITITTPIASPRTAIAYTHRGFPSPRESTSVGLDRFFQDR